MTQKIKSLRVFVEGNDQQLHTMFSEEGFTLVSSIFNADFVVLEGGADVSPQLYDEANQSSYTDANKDVVTAGIFAIATFLGLPIVGICRGHQFLAVTHRGGQHKLDQDIDGHRANSHTVFYNSFGYTTAGDHHQSVIRKVMSDTDISYLCFGGVVEAIMSKARKIVGVQWHPEWQEKGEGGRELFFKLLKDYLDIERKEMQNA